MNTNKQPLSSCHEFPMKVSSSDEGTSYYICGACNQPCDIYVPYPDTTDKLINPLEDKINAIIEANTDEWGQQDCKQIGHETIWLMRSKK